MAVAMATAALLNSLSLFLNLAHILSLVCFLFSFSLSLARLAHSFLPQQPLSISNIIIIQRKKGFKKSIDIDEGRRRREETTLQIRKTKKDVRLAKRRQIPTMGGGGMDTPAALAAASMLAAGGVAPGGYGE